jgi:LmbE family N-acetylglucosaminyl deacetylase
VRYVAFSIATRSLPEGFPPDALAREVREATAELGIAPENLTVHDFDVRTFPEHRQDILELLVALWEEWRPDAVFQPSLHDIHQDHQVIAAERPARVQAHDDPRLRDPVEQLRLRLPGVRLAAAGARRAEGRRAREVRVAAAPALFRSGVHPQRRADARINVNREYAEVFEVYRVVVA